MTNASQIQPAAANTQVSLELMELLEQACTAAREDGLQVDFVISLSRLRTCSNPLDPETAVCLHEMIHHLLYGVMDQHPDKCVDLYIVPPRPFQTHRILALELHIHCEWSNPDSAAHCSPASNNIDLAQLLLTRLDGTLFEKSYPSGKRVINLLVNLTRNARPLGE